MSWQLTGTLAFMSPWFGYVAAAVVIAIIIWETRKWKY